MTASDIYSRRILEEVKKKVQDGLVYTTDIIKEKFPQKDLNNKKEDLENDTEK